MPLALSFAQWYKLVCCDHENTNKRELVLFKLLQKYLYCSNDVLYPSGTGQFNIKSSFQTSICVLWEGVGVFTVFIAIIQCLICTVNRCIKGSEGQKRKIVIEWKPLLIMDHHKIVMSTFFVLCYSLLFIVTVRELQAFNSTVEFCCKNNKWQTMNLQKWKWKPIWAFHSL